MEIPYTGLTVNNSLNVVMRSVAPIIKFSLVKLFKITTAIIPLKGRDSHLKHLDDLQIRMVVLTLQCRTITNRWAVLILELLLMIGSDLVLQILLGPILTRIQKQHKRSGAVAPLQFLPFLFYQIKTNHAITNTVK